MDQSPTISIIMPLRNAERFLRETLDSVIAQSFKDWEILAFDGDSTDGTKSILAGYGVKYPNIRSVSAPSENAYYAILEARKHVHGRYIMVLCASDGYLNRDWLAKCAGALDRDPELSMVWGIPVEMREDGTVVGTHFLYSQFLAGTPIPRMGIIRRVLSKVNIFHPGTLISFLSKLNPTRLKAFGESMRVKGALEKYAWFSYWLKTGLIFPDANMCMASRVFDECMPPYEMGSNEPGDWMEFYYQFNTRGFLSRCIPEVANFSRIHRGQISEIFSSFNDATRANYYRKLAELRSSLAVNPGGQKFQDRNGKTLGSYEDKNT